MNTSRQYLYSFYMLVLGIGMGSQWPTTAQADTLPASYHNGAEEIENFSKNSIKILKAFPVGAELNGYLVVLPSGQQTILYTTADGTNMIIGEVFNQKGENLSAGSIPNAIQSPPEVQNVPSPTALLTLIKKSHLHGFRLGMANAPRQFIMFIDPNCIYCKMMFDGIASYISNNTLSITVIPVAILKPSSLARAGYILTGPNDESLLLENELNFNMQTETGGLPIPPHPDNAAIAAVSQNTRFFKANNLSGTPLIIFTDKTGIARIDNGVPDSIANFVQSLYVMHAK